MSSYLSTDFVVTVIGLVAALAGVVTLLWLERRPREPGKPLLLPTTPLLFLCLLVVVIAMAHMVTLITGVPHRGRLG
jgi:hypothetical protein